MCRFGAQRSGPGQSVDDGQSDGSGREGPEGACQVRRPGRDPREQQYVRRVRERGGRGGCGGGGSRRRSGRHLERRSGWGGCCKFVVW